MNPNPIDWLLEPDDPGVRYLALRDLCSLAAYDPALGEARRLAHTQGPIAEVLNEMKRGGYWVNGGPGYNPKYRSTVWSMILLAQLGAHIAEDERLEQACTYLMDHALTENGQFSTNGNPSNTIDCLQGNLCWALLEMGCSDPRLQTAFDWMARSVTGEGVAPATERHAALRYYAYKCAPGFACGANYRQSCAWGAAKVMLALGLLPSFVHTPLIERAIAQGIDFLFSVDPATAAYPTGAGSKPNQSWFKFGFPVFYITDVLQVVEILAALGCGADPRLANAAAFIRSKADENGRWALEYDYHGKTWGHYGAKGQPNKWVTLRALRALKSIPAPE